MIRTDLELQSALCKNGESVSAEEPCSGSKWIVSLCSLNCISNAKVMDDFPENSIDMMSTGFKPYSRKCPLNEVQLCGFPTIWIGILV
jgi:hypothetical protein